MASSSRKRASWRMKEARASLRRGVRQGFHAADGEGPPGRAEARAERREEGEGQGPEGRRREGRAGDPEPSGDGEKDRVLVEVNGGSARARKLLAARG